MLNTKNFVNIVDKSRSTPCICGLWSGSRFFYFILFFRLRWSNSKVYVAFVIEAPPKEKKVT